MTHESDVIKNLPFLILSLPLSFIILNYDSNTATYANKIFKFYRVKFEKFGDFEQ